MRVLIPALLGALVLPGCEGADAPATRGCPYDAGSGSYGRDASGGGTNTMSGQVECMEQAWMESKRQLTEARAEAMASDRSVSPEVDAEVTEVLNRNVEGSNDEVRLRRLSDAVSDARRLAEVLRAG